MTGHAPCRPAYDGRVSIEGRTTRHLLGYPVSQQKRKRVEEISGWLKTVGLIRKATTRCAVSRLALHLRRGGVQLGTDAQPHGVRDMSQPIPPHAPWLPADLQGGTPPPSRMSAGGLCDGIWGTAVSFNPAFPAAC